MDRNKLIAIGVIVIVLILGIVVLSLSGILGKKQEKFAASVTMWGVLDNEDVFRNIVPVLQKDTGIRLTYVKKDESTYEQDLINALASASGPDIFVFHNTWLPKHKNKLSPAPVDFITQKDIRQNFVDSVFDDFTDTAGVWAMPLSIDNLVLLTNRDTLNSAGIATPPKTWDDFVASVVKLTKRDNRGNILFSGAAIGTARNIAHSQDIISLIMMQSGAKMVDIERQQASFNERVSENGREFIPGQDALEFYTSFASPNKVAYSWNFGQQNSIEAFSQGKVAMIFILNRDLKSVKALAPSINYDISLMPQPSNAAKIINLADYWGFGVSNQSKQKRAAWRALTYLTTPKIVKYYDDTARRPTPLRSLISTQQKDLELGVFADQGLTAKNWYQQDPDEISSIFSDMIESVVLGAKSVSEAMDTAASRVTNLMQARSF